MASKAGLKVVSGGYSQRALVEVSQAVAGDPKWEHLDVIAGNMLGTSRYGLLIRELGYSFTSAVIDAEAESFSACVATENLDDDVGPFSLRDGRVVDLCYVCNAFFETAVGADVIEYPIIHTFTHRLGDGILVPADRVWVGVDSVGIGSVISVFVSIIYDVIEMGAEDYLDLLQSRQILVG